MRWFPRQLPRPRKILLLGMVGWFAFSGGWLTLRWRATRILEGPGIRATWTTPRWAWGLEQRWNVLLPVTRLENLYLHPDIINGADVAWAAKKCGGVQELVIDGNDGGDPPGRGYMSEAYACLRALGRQPAVTSLSIENVGLRKEQIDGLLEQFPGLKKLHLIYEYYPGKNLPALPALEVAYFDGTDFSDEGLAWLLQQSPALRDLDVIRPKLTPAAMRQIPQRRATPLTRFRYYTDASKLERAEANALRQFLLKAWPTAEVSFTLQTEDGDLIHAGEEVKDEVPEM